MIEGFRSFLFDSFSRFIVCPCMNDEQNCFFLNFRVRIIERHSKTMLKSYQHMSIYLFAAPFQIRRYSLENCSSILRKARHWFHARVNMEATIPKNHISWFEVGRQTNQTLLAKGTVPTFRNQNLQLNPIWTAMSLSYLNVYSSLPKINISFATYWEKSIHNGYGDVESFLQQSEAIVDLY